MNYGMYPSVCGNRTEGVSNYEGGFLYNWAVRAFSKWGIAPYGMSPDGWLRTALNLPTQRRLESHMQRAARSITT